METSRGIIFDTTMYAAFIGAIVSFAIWVITFGSERIIVLGQRRSEHKSRLTFLSFLLLGAVSYANRQNKILVDYITQFRNSDNLDYQPLKVTPNPDSQTISNKLDQEEYFSSYIRVFSKKSSAIKAFKNIFSTCNYLYLQQEVLITMSNKFYDVEVVVSKAFAAAMQKALNRIGEEMSNKTIDVVTKQFLELATIQFEKYSTQRKSRSDMAGAMNFYIVPMIEGSIAKYQQSNLATEITFMLLEAKAVFDQALLNRAGYVSELAFMYNNMLEATKSLSEAAMPLIEKYIPEEKEQ